MRTVEQIKVEANQYQQLLDSAPIDIDNPDLLVEYLGGLNTIISRTGIMLAEAQKIRDIAVNETFAKEFSKIRVLSPTLATKFVNSATADQNALLEWVTQLNKTAKHQAENLRTQISYAKEQMKNRISQ
jgi:hypothetical protein